MLSIKMTGKQDLLFSNLLRSLIHATRLKDAQFAEAIGIKRQTLSNYTTGKSEPTWSLLQSIVLKFGVNPAWLLTGEGEMFGGDAAPSQPTVPAEELDEKLTPAQREMLTYKRMMLEVKAPPEKIANGLEAIVMGKSSPSKNASYTTSEPPADPGYNIVHESQSDFGKDL